ncbi:replication-relaxation family protein [Kitasatospora sp. LaBMicrA B282]|uniref:replication-relaxation family protein n=1 Tax=Kitasatospora sp. LaBMicrA B282 TaxID=3420949 RepID=UPI003D09F423
MTTTSTSRPRGRVPLDALIRRLTARDIWVLEMLLEHTYLTSTHLTQLLGVSRRSVNRRLATLTDLGLLSSFRPHHRPGSAPEHHLLGATGASLLAARYATTPAALGWHRDQATRALFSPFLTHDTGLRTFFIQLARPTTGGQLTGWWSERRCARLWGDLAAPDGYGHHTGPHGQTAFFVEYDTGTEPLPRLAAKLDNYAELATATRTRPLLLFTLHSTTREINLHQRLNHHPALNRISVATTGRDQHHPAERAWLPLTHSAARANLAELPGAWPEHQHPARAAFTEEQSTQPSTGARHIPAPGPVPPPHSTAVDRLR